MISSKILFLTSALVILHINPICAQNDAGVTGDSKVKKLSKAEKLFKASFLETRLQQEEALKHILKTMSYEKQYKLSHQVFQKLFDVLKTTRAILENSNFIPALNFPTNVTVIEALGQVLDNTALYCEFQLKLPDITDRIMNIQNDWLVLAKWAIGFSNSTGLYDNKTSHLMNLVCQEMNLIERSENFINPYRKSNTEIPPRYEKVSPTKKKKIFHKGPRMTKPQHSEL